MYQLAWVSTATHEAKREELAELLRVARQKEAALHAEG